MTLFGGFDFELYDFKSNTFMVIAMMAFSLLVFAIYGKYKSIQGLEVSKSSLFMRIKDVGMLNYAIYDDNSIFYNGIVKVAGSPIDNYFGITTHDQPILVRIVKVLCWAEKTYSSMQCTDNDIIEQKQCFEYVTKWVETKNFIDSSNFDNKDYDLNKMPSPEASSCIFKC